VEASTNPDSAGMSTRRKSMYPAPAPVAPAPSSRRKSMMPPPSKLASIPATKVAAKTTASSRAKAAVAKPAAPSKATVAKPAAKSVKTGIGKKATTTTKSVRVAETVNFVSAEAFDFGVPLEEEQEPVADVPTGPMTRARRRTSVFVGRVPPPAATKAKKASRISIEQVDEDVSFAVEKTVSPSPVQTSTAVKANAGPALKLTEPLTPIVELKRMPSGEYKNTPARRQTAQKSSKKVAKKSPLAVVPINITPLKSAKKKVQKAAAAPIGTPGAPVDPINVLKRNVKKKVEAGLEAKVAGLPGNSSPYAMLTGQTESGSPVQRFVKIKDRAAKYVTGTPAKPPPDASGRRRNVRTASKRNMTLEESDENDGSPKLKKRQRSSGPFHGVPTAVKAAAAALELTVAEADEDDESRLPPSSPQVASPPSSPEAVSPGTSNQLVTGSLAKACIVM